MIEFPVKHTVFEAICIMCHERWIACVPDTLLLKQLQCPKCLKHGYVIMTGQKLIEE